MQFALSVPIGGWHDLLPITMESLRIQQETASLNVAVLDASSNSRVSDLLDQYADIIAYRRTGPDAGQTSAIMEGWSNTEGDVLGWLNYDDALYPGACLSAKRAIEEYGDDVVYGQSTILDEAGWIVGYHWAVAAFEDGILRGCPISQPSCFFRRDAYERAGGLNADLHYTMDWDLWVRLYTTGARFRMLPDVMSQVLWTSAAKTGGFGAGRVRELFRLLRQHNSLGQAVKSLAGFGLHHVLEYVVPDHLSHILETRLPSGSLQKFGVSRSGHINQEATLTIANLYRDVSSYQIEVRVDGDATVQLDEASALSQADKDGIFRLQVPRGVAPGSVASLQISPRHAGCRLLGARLC